MSKNILFPFTAMSSNDPAMKEVARHFKKAGANVVQAEVNPAIRRTSGIAYREIHLSFTDSQIVTLRIKETGDIYQVLLNKKVVPIRDQDDHSAAIKEVAKLMERGRAAFQRKLAKARVALPSSVKTAAPKMEALLVQRRDSLAAEIAAIDSELEALAAG